MVDSGDAREIKTEIRKDLTVPHFNANDGTEIYYKDWAMGDPIVFSHGWPLNADAWETTTRSSPIRTLRSLP
jgi:pimeloyl-ACP methyl ester carboxylesterase